VPKKPEQTLEERVRTLEQQRQHAADAITLAKQRAEEIAARQQQIAVAVIGEDAEAVAENQRLEETLLIEGRRRATARSAAQQLDAEIEEAKAALAEQGRRGHLEKAAVLARERYELEQRAEEEVSRLLATLDELERLDRRHGHQLRAGGAQPPTDSFGWTIEPWLLTRLGAWVRDNPSHQAFMDKTLAELDSLAHASKQQHQGRGSVA
jgi:uncharacterized membrane protein YccC